MTTIRLTMAQALVRFLASQNSEIDGREYPLFAGVFAIFGHGNVAGLGEALYAARERLPTLRAHNEQAMALAAVAFAKASRRRHIMRRARPLAAWPDARTDRRSPYSPFGSQRPADHNQSLQKSEQTGTGFRSKAAGDFGGKRHLISLQSDTRFRRFRHP